MTYRLDVRCDFKNGKSVNEIEGIFCFWHQNIVSTMFFFFQNKVIGHCIVSSSVDGKIAGFLSKKLGFKIIYGSVYKDSFKLVRQVFDILELNKRICLAGDGSRGPAFELKQGIKYLAMRSGLPLIFVESHVRWAFTFNSWDRFKLPLPFSRISIHLHDPIRFSQEDYLKRNVA